MSKPPHVHVQAARAACVLAVLLAAAAPARPQAVLRDPVVPIVATGPKVPAYIQGGSRLPQIARQIPGYLADKQWDTLAHALEMLLLEAPQSPLVPERLRDAASRPYVHWSSPAARLDAIVAGLNDEALKVYKETYGDGALERYRARAGELLTEARKNNDVRLLAQVAGQYRHSEAGAEALALLAAEQFDSGQYLSAALCYGRLLHHPRANPKPAALYTAAVAFRKVGDTGNAELAWKRLKDRIGKEGLSVEGRKVTARQARAELDRVTPLSGSEASDWPVFQGNATRSGRAAGGRPDLAKPLWKRATLMDRGEEGLGVDRGEALKPLLEQALKERTGPEAAPALPGFFPVAVGDKVIYRTYVGVTAVYLTEVKDKQGQVEGKPGDIYWKATDLDGSAGVLFSDAGLRGILTSWLKRYEAEGRDGILFENLMTGTLACDGRYVYAVDDLAVPPLPPAPSPFPQKAKATHPKLEPLIAQNSLQAFNLHSGKIEWRLGNSWQKDDPFNGSHWLGPPLPLAGAVYALSETHAGELRLVCVEPAKGKVLLVRPLARVQDNILKDVRRRTQPVQLAYQGGLLVCPTNAGAVLGVDLATQSVAWAYTYREGRRPPSGKDPASRFALPADLLEPPQWRNTAPVIADGKVVFTAPDEGSVHCLNLRDGSLVWRSTKDEGDLYLAGVYDGKVLVVGKAACRALDLASGKEAWRLDTGVPSGMGVAAGGTYYLPLRSTAESKRPAVCAIDVAKGRIVRVIPAGEDVPGNLLFHGGQLISQGPLTVTAYPLTKAGSE